MTTGGGWQDQIGAVYGGFKIARSASSLPVRVSVQSIPTTAGKFSNHCVCCGFFYKSKTMIRCLIYFLILFCIYFSSELFIF